MAREATLNVAALVQIDVPAPRHGHNALEPLPDGIVRDLTMHSPKHATEFEVAARAAKDWRSPEPDPTKWTVPVLFLRGNCSAKLAGLDCDSHWILREKSVQSATGWEAFFGDRLHVIEIEDANHFTIVGKQKAEQVAKSIDTFVKMAVNQQ